MILYLHSHDIYDRGRTFGRHRRVRDLEHITVARADTIPVMVRAAAARVRNRRSIWLLIFNAHGTAGQISIGRGLDAISVYDLAPLRPYMTPGGPGVEIHSCNVASPQAFPHDPRFLNEGLEFLRRMAHVLDCTVKGSSHQQRGVEEGFFGPVRGSDTWGRFEGDYAEVRPDGTHVVVQTTPPCASGSCALPPRP